MTWLDVVVHTEKICRIVPGFKSDKTIVVAPVGLSRDGFSFIRHVIAIRPCSQIRPQPLPALARPANVLVGLGRIGPDGPRKKVPCILPVGKGGVAGRHPRGCSVPMLDKWRKCIRRGTLAHVLCERLNRIIGEVG